MPYRYTEEELKAEIQRLSEQLERIPRAKDMTEYGKYGENTYLRRFNSWNEALEESGMGVNKEYNISKDVLKDELLRLFQAEEQIPSSSLMNDSGRFSEAPYIDKFGSWNEALRESGIEPEFHQDIGEKELLDELYRLESVVEKTPTYEMMEKQGRYGKSTYERVFGSWNNALEEAGYTLNKLRDGNRRKVEYGPSWILSNKREILLRDQYRCQACLTGENKLGQRPDLHHIEPARYWDVEKEHEEMNNSDNLISLCRSCHRTYQGLWRSLEPEEFAKEAKKEFNS